MIWWHLSFILPLIAAVAALVWRAPAQATTSRWRVAAIAGQWAALAPAVVLTLWPPPPLQLDWLLLATTLRIDVVGRALTFVTVVLFGAALTAIARRRTPRAGELSAFLLVCYTGTLGVFTAGDAVTFYLSFTVMSYAAVGLVLNNRTPEARRAAAVYMVLAVVSEVASLTALVFIVSGGGADLTLAPQVVATSAHRDLIVACLLVGFGIKAGAVPLHVWLPLAHPAAPPAASAVLSGAMVKAGIVGWLRFLPLGEAPVPRLGTALVFIGVVGAFGAVIVGLQQQQAKTVLAYSTISQLGFMTITIGVGLVVPGLAPACVMAVVIYAVHHGLAKGAAFLGIAVWSHHGFGRRRYVVIAGMVLASAAIVGAPFSSGAIGKYASKSAIDGVTLLGLDVVALLPWVATGSTLLLLRTAQLLGRSTVEPQHDRVDPEYLSWLGLAVLSAFVPWIVADAWVPLADVPGLDAVTLWDATWPVLAAIPIWALLRVARPWLRRLPRIPQGDLVVPAEHAVQALRGLPELPRPSRGARLPSAVGQVSEHLSAAEGFIQRWSVGLGALIALTVIIMVGGR